LITSRNGFQKEAKMKSRSVGIWKVFWVIVAVLMAYPSFAREGAESTGSRRFNPKTVETVKGEVVRVDKVASPGGKGYGLHLTVKTEKETLSVEVGPGWYVEKQPVRIEAKDILEIRGSRITSRGKPVMIAAEIKKRDQILKLRDENGIPAWSGGSRRPSN
jgi:hypothetical protein